MKLHIILLNMEENPTCQPTLQSILEKNYEDRSKLQHDILALFLMRQLEVYTLQQSKWLSLLCTYFPNLSDHESVARLQIEPQSVVIAIPTTQIGESPAVVMKIQEGLPQFPSQGFLIIISKRNLSNCLSIAEQSIQEMVRILRSFQYLSQVPRKRFYHILRNIDILNFSFGQLVYLQNQTISNELSVYFVRKGEFTFLKRQRSTHKNVELYTFSQGYLFGTEEESQFEAQSGQILKKIKEKRMFTVRCQSSEGVVYRIKLDFFNSFLRKSCESLLRSNSLKLNRFFEERFVKAEMNLTKNAQFITQPFRRSLSIQAMYSKRDLPSLQSHSQQPNNDPTLQGKKSSLPSINMKSELPSRRKLPSKDESKKMSPEYQEQKIILLKQYKCEMIKQSTKGTKPPPCKGEVLLNLMKTTYQFEKLKSKKHY